MLCKIIAGKEDPATFILEPVAAATLGGNKTIAFASTFASMSAIELRCPEHGPMTLYIWHGDHENGFGQEHPVISCEAVEEDWLSSLIPFKTA